MEQRDRQEHRTVVRWGINRPAGLMLDGACAYSGCRIKDISFKGLRIILGQKLSSDSFIKFKLFICEECHIEIEAWVAWHSKFSDLNVYGLYFTKIKDSDKAIIYRYIQKNFPQEISKNIWGDQEEERGEVMEDKRIFARINAKFALRFIDSDTGKEGSAQTLDISAKGIGFITKEEVPRPSSLEMWLDIPDQGESFYTRGQVAWSKRLSPAQNRIGIELEKADLMGLSRVLRLD
ncbi:MAG: PilZ domain-containing protein [Candidatus Omnitrophota bacterium]|jgi:hypothetical protein|nr:MAG: PilZ domain-containing protein [Candidatus Omnitrophota bacterium]